jgi:hypothetical protein
MKREVRSLLDKCFDGLLLAVELFNRPDETARAAGVLIILDHSVEMLLKAAIVHQDGRILDAATGNTIGCDACIRRATSSEGVRCLDREQATVLMNLNGQRDAAQHYLNEITEQQLYVYTQATITVVRDVLKAVFAIDLCDVLPRRVLPVSTLAPAEIDALFESEAEEIRKLLAPGKRRRLEAQSRLRSLAILENSIRRADVEATEPGAQTPKEQPSAAELRRAVRAMGSGVEWAAIFPSIASLALDAQGEGYELSLRITKREGAAIHLVHEDDPRASVVGVKRVNELGYYNMNLRQLSDKVGLTTQRTLAAVWYLKLQDDEEFYKEFDLGAKFKRYSQLAIGAILGGLSETPIDVVWAEYRQHQKRKRQAMLRDQGGA